MQDLSRALWFARLWSAVLVLVLAAATAGLPWPVPAIALALAVVVEIAAGLATRSLLIGMDDDDGELMYTNGTRLPLAGMQRMQRIERVELWVGVGFAGMVIGATPFVGGGVGVGAALLAGLLHLAIGLQRRANQRLTDALVALQRHDPDRALALVRPLLRMPPAQRLPAETYEALALLQRGEVDEGRARMEERWSGALDASAVTIALLRLHAGDATLADRWLAAEHPDDRYHRYLRALVGASRRLVAEDAEAARQIAASVTDVPPYYLRELRLVGIAALQLEGRTAEAKAQAAALDPPLTTDAWRARAYPRLWQLLSDASQGRPTVGAPARPGPRAMATAPKHVTADAFAPPQADEPVTVPMKRRREVGAVPAEWLALDTWRARWVRILLLVLSVTLLAVAVVVTPLVVIAVIVGSQDELLLAESGVIGLAYVVGGALALSGMDEWRAPRRPAIRLADGRAMSDRFWAGGVVPLAGAALALPMLPVTLWLSGAQGAGVSVVMVPLGLVFLLALVTRVRAIRVVRAVHLLPPDEAVEIAREQMGRFRLSGPGGRTWLALALLQAGEAEAAERELAEAALLLPDARELTAWFRAGRGEIELEHLLRRPEPDALGPAYRHAVTCALAALKADAPARVLPRVERWTHLADELPNRFGSLLHRLVLAVLVRADAGRADACRARHPEIAEAAWVERVWPFAAT